MRLCLSVARLATDSLSSWVLVHIMDLPKEKLTKTQLLKLKKKQRKVRARQREKEQKIKLQEIQSQDAPTEDDNDVEVEYVVSDPFANSDSSDYVQLKEVFERFSGSNDAGSAGGESQNEAAAEKTEEKKVKLSRRQRKLAKRVNIAVLKQLVARPELVEVRAPYPSTKVLWILIERCLILALLSHLSCSI